MNFNDLPAKPEFVTYVDGGIFYVYSDGVSRLDLSDLPVYQGDWIGEA